MKRKSLYLIIAGIGLLLVVVFSFSRPSINWTVPKSLIGNWTGKQKVTVRFENNGKYSFTTAHDSVKLTLTIKENGGVSGSFGTAMFENCYVTKNRRLISKKLNLYTDYIITGKLAGVIFPTDTIVVKKISFPFNLADNTIGAATTSRDLAIIEG